MCGGPTAACVRSGTTISVGTAAALAPPTVAVGRVAGLAAMGGYGRDAPIPPPRPGRSIPADGPRFAALAALARAGFRRYSTYRQATVAAAFTNTVFGFLRCYVLLARSRPAPAARRPGTTPAQLATLLLGRRRA